MHFTFELLEEKGFSPFAINQLLRAQQNGTDISQISVRTNINTLRKLADHYNLTAENAKFFCICEQYNVDMSFLTSGEYNQSQIKQITDAIKLGLDYKILMDPALSTKKMKIIKEGSKLKLPQDYLLNAKINESDINNYKLLVGNIKATKSDFDVQKYINENYRINTIYIIYNAYNSNIDLFKYIEPKDFNVDSLKAIFNILKKDPDIDKKRYPLYFKKEYCKNIIEKMYQMDILGFPIEKLNGDYTTGQINVLYSIYASEHTISDKLFDDRFTPAQLDMIKTCMNKNLDYTKLLNPDIKACNMRVLISDLEFNRNNPEKQIDIDLLTSKNLDNKMLTHASHVLKYGTLDEKLKIFKEIENLDIDFKDTTNNCTKNDEEMTI